MVLAHNVTNEQRTRDVEISVDVTFDSMLLANNTFEGLKNSGFYKPSPIQLHGIPLGKCGFDLYLEAKSGTGKTAVFTVIALEKLDLDKGLQCIILAPTREIAAQISDVVKQIGSSYKDLNVEVVMGGLPIEEDIEKFQKKVHILVGSPGRMRHLIQNNHMDVTAVRLLVLDEADKLMDKSFQADINFIFSILPKQKQVIMSSATYPDSLKTIMENYVQKAQHICPESTSILLGIKQQVTTVKSNINIVRQTQNKFEQLLKILSNREFKQCLIFCNYQVRVGELCKMLIREKWPAEQLHGQLEQMERLDALKTLQEYKCRILVSTDLAARGIDASNVDLVINFEPPFEWQTYLHRIGRAGRFGSYGIAITILSEGKEHLKFKEMIKDINCLSNLDYLWGDNKFELDDSVENNATIQKQGQKILETPYIENTSESSDIRSEKLIETSCFEEMCGKAKKTPPCEILAVEMVKNTEPELHKALKMDSEDIFKLKSQFLKITESLKCNEDNITNDQNFVKANPLEKLDEFKIESFNDLMESYKDYKSNNIEEMEMEDITFNTNFDSMFTIENECNLVLGLSSDIEPEIEINTEKEAIAAESKPKSEINTKEILSKINDKFEKKIFHWEHHTTPDMINTCNSLKDAGLPTSFGSTKYCNNKLENKSKSLNNNEKSNRHGLSKIKNKQLNHRDKCQQMANREKEIHLKCTNEASVSFNDGYNTHSELNNKSIKYVQNQQHNCSNNIKSSSSKMCRNALEKSTDICTKYTNWYKQLKMCIKQIEMSLYVDELSKN